MKTQLKNFLLRAQIPRIAARFGSPKVVILRYHSVQAVPLYPAGAIADGIIHSAALFDEQMDLVARRFHPITVNDVVVGLRGDRPFPRRAVAITFDDGFADNHDVAAPILARHGLSAAFYVTVSPVSTGRSPWFCRLRSAFHRSSARQWVHPTSGQKHDMTESRGRRGAFLDASGSCAVLTGDRQDSFLSDVESALQTAEMPTAAPVMMNWEQVAALRQAGHIVGSHSMSHPNLAQCPPAEALREIRESKRLMEERLGSAVEHFSYPSPILEPHCTAETSAFVEQAGYESAVTCLPGAVRADRSPFSLPRIPVPKEMGEFRWALEASLAGRVL